MQSNGNDNMAKGTYPSLAADLATVNGIIISRVCELLSSRQGTMFESPDGNCAVICLQALRHDNVAAAESSIEKCGNRQPQDSLKSGSSTQSKCGFVGRVASHLQADMPESPLSNAEGGSDEPSMTDGSALSGSGELAAASKSEMS